MEIESISHKALRSFAETGKAKGLPGNLVARLRNMLAWLSVIEMADELLVPPNFGAHLLSGDRAGTWSLTVSAAAEKLGVSRQAMSSLLNGRAGISAEMAIRFEKAFGLRADSLLRMQAAHDLAEARRHEKDIKVEKIAA